MNITLSNSAQLSINDISTLVLNCVKKDLTLDNPQLIKRMNLNLSLFNVSPKIKLYEDLGTTLVVPIGYVDTLVKYLAGFTSQDFVDNRTCGDFINVDFVGNLRDYQHTAVESLEQRSVGVISAPTGSGKTVMMCKLIADRQVKTLVLVNTLELANQFKDNVLKYTTLKDSEVNIISAGAKFKLGAVTVALLQSAHKFDDAKLDEINAHVGMVLTDEVHIVGASTYFETLNKFTAKHKYGFSATPEREDGLTQLIYMASGPLRREISAIEVAAAGNILLPEVRVVPTTYHFPLFDMNEYQIMISDLCSDTDRNQLIAETVQSEDYATKQKVLLCGRVMQAIHLQQLIPNSKILVGSISKEDLESARRLYPSVVDTIQEQKGKKYRKQIVEELNSGKLNTVISTYSLFSTGLDFKELEVAAFCSPVKSKILVKQCRGRIMRVAAGKQPICLDFEDTRVDLLKQQSRTRQRILKRF
jgi:superfamily II DNA or RNA helicase